MKTTHQTAAPSPQAPKKAKHGKNRQAPRPERPVHPSQIRADVRAAMDIKQEQLKAEDDALESAVLSAHREVRLASSIPALCIAAMACPGITRRMAFQAVAVQTGFHESHVQRLFYRSRTLLGDPPFLLRAGQVDEKEEL